jgi:hypothetical protein
MRQEEPREYGAARTLSLLLFDVCPAVMLFYSTFIFSTVWLFSFPPDSRVKFQYQHHFPGKPLPDLS